MIDPNKERIREIINDYKLESEFNLTIYTDIEDKVEIVFETNLLNSINYFNSSLDIDLIY